MKRKDKYGLSEFLKKNPFMSISPSRGTDLIIRGKVFFRANIKNGPEISDRYQLEIRITDIFPKELPEVKEIDLKIPRDGNFHVNPDGTLCLGSHLRLLSKLHNRPSLTGFTEDCLVPYLYAVTYKLWYGGKFIFNELDHGNKGVLDDYKDLFHLETSVQVIYSLKLLGKKKRLANKKLCPCGCGQRLGVCPFHNRLNKFRQIAPRAWYKSYAQRFDNIK